MFLLIDIGCIWRKANISVGAKHDRSQSGIITNNLYAVMLRPLQKPDAPIDIWHDGAVQFLCSIPGIAIAIQDADTKLLRPSGSV